jgi:WD40 repeat protein
VGEIFISYAAADRTLAGQVSAGIRLAGRGVFIDSDPEDGIAPGAAWRRTLFREMRLCDALVFLNSPAAQDSKWCHAELLVAAELGKRIYPLDLSPGLAPHPLLGSVQGITFDTALGDSVRRLNDRLKLDGLAGAGWLRLARGRPPYPGLAAMDTADAGVFFGRDDDVQRLRDRVDRPLGQRDGDLVIVLGPSGAGKSSLVRAGLAARLAVPGSGWAVAAPFEPGLGPLNRLTTELAALVPEGQLTEEECRARVAREGLAAFGEWLADRAGARRLLIMVDQAEQLVAVTLAADRGSFLSVLGGGLGPGSPVTVVMTARSDRLDEIQQLAEIGASIRDPIVIAPLDRSRLAQVIEGPASRADLTFEPGLVGRLVADAARGPRETADALPLLAFVLREMYDRLVREDRTIFTDADYEWVGRIDGVIDRQARAAERALPAGSEELLNQMLTKFVALDGERLPVARPVSRERLTAAERDIAKSLEDQRLLAGTGVGRGAGEDQRPLAGSTGTVRLAHERLIVAWPRLARVVADHRDDLLMHTRLERQAADWKEGHGTLLSQEATEEARAWQSRSATGYDADIIQYIAASEAALRRRRRTRNRVLSLLVTLTLIASGIAVWAGVQRSNAVTQSGLAQSEALAAEAANLQTVNGPLSMLLSLQAYERTATPEARSAVIQTGQQPLRRLLQASISPIRDVAFSPDKRTLAVADDQGRITLWNFTTGKRLTPKPLTQGSSTVWSLAFSPDGHTLAVGDDAGNIGLWNTATGKQETPKPLNEGGKVWSLEFSPHGDTLAVGDNRGHIRLWDWTRQKLIVDLNEGQPVQSLIFSPDGHALVAGTSGGYVTAWNVKTKKWTRTDHISSSVVWSVAFSPDGHTVAAGDWAGKVFLWDAATGRQIGALREGAAEDTVWGVAFSPDGRTLAAGDGYGNIGLWDVATRTRTRTLAVGSQVLTVEFSRDGGTLAVGDDVGDVSLWDGTAGQRYPASVTEGDTVWDVALSPDGHTLADASDTIVLRDPATGKQTGDLGQRATSIAFSPDGSRLVAGGDDGYAVVWNMATKTKMEELKDGSPLYGVAFSPDGRTVAAGGDNGSHVVLWNTATKQHIDLPEKQRVYSVAFSPDGNILAAGDVNGHVLLWNSASAKLIADLNEGTTVWDVAFSPDGRTLAVGDFTGHVGLWRIESGKWKRALTLPVGTEVRSVAFSPDAPTTLVSGDTLGNVSIWDTVTGHELASLPETDHGAIGLAFPEKGQILAIAGMDGEVVLLRQDLRDLSQKYFTSFICGKVHASMTQVQWGKYAPGQTYQRTCP